MRGLIVYSKNMEDVEALATKALLVRAGYHMDSMTFNPVKVLKTAYKQSIMADFTFDEIDVNAYDFLVIPGGKYVSETIDKDQDINSLAKRFYTNNKYVCAICAAPLFLGKAKLLENIKYTAFPGTEKMIDQGHYLGHKKVVSDDLFITARSAGAVYDFVYEIVKNLSNKDKADALFKSIYY